MNLRSVPLHVDQPFLKGVDQAKTALLWRIVCTPQAAPVTKSRHNQVIDRLDTRAKYPHMASASAFVTYAYLPQVLEALELLENFE